MDPGESGPGRRRDEEARRFVEKWSRAELTERAASHEHFLDLCRLLDVPSPASADATGADYCFEKHVKVVRSASKGSKGEHGFVDVWKRGHFAWEYKQKGKYKDLDEAYRQLYQYRDDLDNPPLSVTCDIRNTEIRTHFSGYPTQKTVVKLEEVPSKLGVLRWIFTDPDSFRRTQKTTETITRELANEFGTLADDLIARYPPDELKLWESAGSPVAHFLMKVMFCLFAEDVGLLPAQAFTKLIGLCTFHPEQFEPEATNLFNLMRTGGRFGFDTIPWFNGGLFDDAPALPLKHGDLLVLRKVAGDAQNWSGVEPSIFGTLFERILDPRKRAQIGAHYTDKKDILLVVEPVMMAPLRRRWQQTLDQLAPTLAKHDAEPDRKKRDVLSGPVRVVLDGFRRFLGQQRVLDPACGSGNFLYVALQQLLDLDEEVVRFAARRDITLDPIPYVRPTQLHGIEINPYAAELAQVVIWIGYLQWLHVRGLENPKRPILDKLQTIENRDAILAYLPLPPGEGRGEGAGGRRKKPVPAEWPEAHFIIGNPPFLGSKLFRKSGLTDNYLKNLWEAFDLPRASDLCCYWFESARRQIERRSGTRAGLLATQAIRGGENRQALDRIKSAGDIFLAWSDREWVLDGAAVHVSIVGFDHGDDKHRELDGARVSEIHANLTAGTDMTAVEVIEANTEVGWTIGTQKSGDFDIEWTTARSLLATPSLGGGSLDVLFPWVNGKDVMSRSRGKWIIYFDGEWPIERAAQYEPVFEYVRKHVKPTRDPAPHPRNRELWWVHERPRPGLTESLSRLRRAIVTPTLTKHRTFIWTQPPLLPDKQTVIFLREDDYFFGVLHSSLHELWARRLGTQLREVESGFRYTPSSCFETFPLPWPPGREDVNHPAYRRIAAAAKALDEQRERWLNPPEWLDPIAARVDASDDFADVPAAARPLLRRSAILAAAAKDPRLKNRTLTKLYNDRPTWLRLAHEQLDRAVLAAYAATNPAGGWGESWAEVWADSGAGQPLPPDHSLRDRRADIDRRVLGALLRLNHHRAGGSV